MKTKNYVIYCPSRLEMFAREENGVTHWSQRKNIAARLTLKEADKKIASYKEKIWKGENLKAVPLEEIEENHHEIYS